MKALLLTSFIVIANLFANAQDWQCIKSNDTVYYQNSDNYILTTQIDSVHYVSGDSILFPFKSFRFGNFGNQYFYYSGPSWFGSKIFIKPNGVNIFLNKQNDSIFINSLAILGDTFTVYQYPNDPYDIKGIVTDYTIDTILGNTDSVKTIQLLSSKPNDSLNNKSFILSKHFGFIKIIPFYSFPLIYNGIDDFEGSADFNGFEYSIIGKENPKLGVTKPTFNDVYDVEIGDILQYEFNGYPCDKTYEKEIINKTMINADSVSYEIKRTSWGYCEATGPNDPGYSIPLVVDTIIEKYRITDDYLSDKIYEKFYPPSAFYTKGIITTCGYHFYEIGNFVVADYDTITNTYYLTTWHLPSTSHLYLTKAFSYYSGYSDPQVSWDSSTGFIARINQDGTCGNRFYLGLDDISKESKMEIYPNPATNQLNIKGNYQSFQIYNSIGHLVSTSNQPNQIIDISDLPQGLYIIKISTVGDTDEVFTTKFIKE